MQLPLWLVYLGVIVVVPWLGNQILRLFDLTVHTSAWRLVMLLGITGTFLLTDIQHMGWQGLWQAKMAWDSSALLLLVGLPLLDLLMVALPYSPLHHEH
jgi:hypothetical protein